MKRVMVGRSWIIGCATVMLIAAAIFAWDAVANEGMSARTVALAIIAGGAGLTFLHLGVRVR